MTKIVGVALVALTTLATCGPDVGIEPTFIAHARDFEGFEAWPHETIGDAVPDGAAHVAGLRTIYLHLGAAPAADATGFPLGTILVKKTAVDGKIFAQVKRGGGFNAAGAKNWEWFELVETPSRMITIPWHGTAPVAGEAYVGGSVAGCNPCHKADAANDYVLAPGLTLAGFSASSVDAGADAVTIVPADGARE